MRREMMQHLHKVLWNWGGGEEECPVWMQRLISESPGALLQKRASGEVDEQAIWVAKMEMDLPACSLIEA
jgi:hypothetical protein